MACACFSVAIERLEYPFAVGFERLDESFAVSEERLAYPFAVTWERCCGTIVDLVPFSASDGMFLTNEGYTILVKI